MMGRLGCGALYALAAALANAACLVHMRPLHDESSTNDEHLLIGGGAEVRSVRVNTSVGRGSRAPPPPSVVDARCRGWQSQCCSNLPVLHTPTDAARGPAAPPVPYAEKQQPEAAAAVI